MDATSALASALMVAAGAIQLLPVLAAWQPSAMVALYGIDPKDPTEVLLLRHRGALLAILGVALMVAAAIPQLQLFGLALGILTRGAYLALHRGTPNPTPEATRMARTDVITLALLLLAVVLVAR